MEVEWANLKAGELRDLAAREAIVVLPVAAMEQHGPHLPVMVDTLLCGEVANARREAGFGPAPGGRGADRLERPVRAPHAVRRHLHPRFRDLLAA